MTTDKTVFHFGYSLPPENTHEPEACSHVYDGACDNSDMLFWLHPRGEAPRHISITVDPEGPTRFSVSDEIPGDFGDPTRWVYEEEGHDHPIEFWVTKNMGDAFNGTIGQHA